MCRAQSRNARNLGDVQPEIVVLAVSIPNVSLSGDSSCLPVFKCHVSCMENQRRRCTQSLDGLNGFCGHGSCVNKPTKVR